MGHDYCFARKLAHGRLRERYLANKHCAPVLEPPMHYIPSPKNKADPFYPRFWPERLEKLDYFLAGSRKPVGVFLSIMGEWAGDWIPREWQEAQFELIGRHPKHKFYLLSHCPQNLAKFSPFPPNCYVGVTVTSNGAMTLALESLANIQATVRFISFEPLLGSIGMSDHMSIKGIVDWVIIGAMTGTKADLWEYNHLALHDGLKLMPWEKRYTLQPPVQWLRDIVESADRARVKVFLKDNLMPLFEAEGITKREDWTGIRQEMPR